MENNNKVFSSNIIMEKRDKVFASKIITENSNKVFSSNIIRNENPAANNLTELLHIVPAKPLPVNGVKSDCDFWPKTGKHYVPKRKSRLKVKTVRNIRNVFEQDTYTYLLNDLEKQHNVLLKKIRDGTSKKECTKTLAKNILNSEQPISRTAWEMLVHLNPEQHRYPQQCVLWSGRNIQINGSRGGNHRFLCNYDLSANRPPMIKRIHKNKICNTRKSLLKNSLKIKFKPGPLGKKIFLDDSHQKYHVGDIKLVDLPKLGLDIQPAYGMTLGSTISSFLDNLREDSGIISQKWAEFAVSVLGSIKKSRPVQITKGCVTFDLNYKCNQRRMLMRLDHDNISPTAKVQNKINLPLSYTPKIESTDVIKTEVKCLIDNMIDSIEISSQQNNFYSKEDVTTPKNGDGTINKNMNQLSKDKQKRKYCELDRLAVTVIRVPEGIANEANRSCNKSHCSLGCICDSLECTYNTKQHCGRTECMFKCKCNFSKYDNMKSLGTEGSEITGLLNLNNERHLKLSKEEQKFHQTVIVTGEKSILLKTQKRNWKSSKKYADFYNNMSLKPETKKSKILSILCSKLDCASIEPWCMVHNLYKCFCKGKFTESFPSVIVPDINNKNDIRPLLRDDKIGDLDHEKSIHDAVPKPCTRQVRKSYVPRYDQNCNTLSNVGVEDNDDHQISTCARINEFKGKKFNDEYYHNTNKKISEMEKNDNKLHKKLVTLMNDNKKSNKQPIPVNNIQPSASKQVSHDINESQKSKIVDLNSNKKSKKAPDLLKLIYLDSEEGLNLDALHKENKSKLVAWLEFSYQQYKRQLDQGYVKKCLDPPRKGKLVLYTWNLILSRYREHKNLFLVTKKKPFRVFIVIHNNHPLFKLCINIDDIKFDDLAEYPLTVKNLLTNATNLTDIFCILRGLSHCWELVGSVNKLGYGNRNKVSEHEEEDTDVSTSDSECKIVFESTDNTESLHIKPKTNSVTERVQSLEASKWFVMTLENDFTEIQFYKRGFFVQYDSIVKAINVARMSGKTVRLSSKKCADKCNDPRFGIYAIPNANEDCVFVGPYEIDEPMGIETVKTSTISQNIKRTRGVWITTKKVDNLKVIDNPLSFILPNQYSEMVPLETDNDTSENIDLKNNTHFQTDTKKRNESSKSLIHTVDNKIVKPIKIRRTNGFYHLAPNGILQKLSKPSPRKNDSSVTKSLIINATLNDLSSLKSNLVNNNSKRKTISGNSVIFEEDFENGIPPLTPIIDKPVEFIPSDIKITSVYSTAEKKIPERNVSEKGMSILKPEEINKKLLFNKTFLEPHCIDDDKGESSVLTQDIENFLATSVINNPQDDVYIISDDEEYEKCEPNSILTHSKEVFIRCTNIEGVGWINGKKDNNSFISFEFPGFKYSAYYKEEEALAKINQVLSRKIYVPKNINLEWEVVESAKLIDLQQKLTPGDLGSDLILTKQGIRNKYDLTISGRSVTKTYTRKRQNDTDTVSVDASLTSSNHSEEENPFGFEESSKKLENENHRLWNKTVAQKSEILHSMTNASEKRRNEMTESLKTIMVMAEDI